MTSEIGTLRGSLTEMTELLQRILSSQQAAAMPSSQKQVSSDPSLSVGHAGTHGYSNDGVKLIDQNGGTYRIMNTPGTAQDEIDIRQIQQHAPAPGGRMRTEPAIGTDSRFRSHAGMQQRPAAGLAAESSYESAGSVRSYSGHR